MTHPPPPHTSPLSLHDALPISLSSFDFVLRGAQQRPCQSPPPRGRGCVRGVRRRPEVVGVARHVGGASSSRASYGARSRDRKSTRLNSSHVSMSYAVVCLEKKT